MLRSLEPRATKVAPSAIMIAGWSFPGSPFATFPPMVPRLRTSGSAIRGTASARIGSFLFLDGVEPRDAPDIDKVRVRREAQLEHGQEAHASREHLRFAAVALEELQGLSERVGTVIIKRRRNHRSPLSARCAPHHPRKRMPTGYYSCPADGTLARETKQALPAFPFISMSLYRGRFSQRAAFMSRAPRRPRRGSARNRREISCGSLHSKNNRSRRAPERYAVPPRS